MHPTRRQILARWAILGAAACVALTAVACRVTYFERQLPDWVSRVYVPMVVNETFEPGLEELVTNAFVEELLADGRIQAVRRSQCDAIARVTLHDYTEVVEEFDSDDIASIKRLQLTLSLKLLDPADPERWLARAGRLVVNTKYRSDYRATGAELDVDALDRLAHSAGMQLVHAMVYDVKLPEEPEAVPAE